jgi:sec-independent protein translocase protein TatB
MDFFGIGVLELFFIVLIALIVLGPKDMVKAGRTMGAFLRKLMLSPGFMEAQRWVRNLPAQLMREAGIDEIQNELRQEAARIKQETTVSIDMPNPKLEPANTIAKPASTQGAASASTSGSLSPTYPPPLTPYAQGGAPRNSSQPPTRQPPARPGAVQPGQNGEGEEGLEDIPLEWVASPGAQAGRVKIDDEGDIPIEWISPPGTSKKPPIILGHDQPAQPNENGPEQE